METDTDRSQILADFQVCANIEDIEHALTILEEVNWDLTNAINMVLSNDERPGAASTNDNTGSLSVNGGGFDVTGTGIPRAEFLTPLDVPLPSRTVFNHFSSNISEHDSSREVIDHYGVHRRLIHFHAQYKDLLIKEELADSQTVDDLKDIMSLRIRKDKSQIGIVWQDGSFSPEDNNTLRELNLPRENTIRLVTYSESQASTSSTSTSRQQPLADRSISEDLCRVYKLQIEITVTMGNSFTKEVSEAGTKTVQEIKEDIQNGYGIPTFSQNWNGWSSHVTDDTTLAGCQLNLPVHVLTVCRKGLSQGQVGPVSRSSSRSSRSSRAGTHLTPYNINSDSDSDHDCDMLEDNDLDLERMSPTQSGPSRTPLIPGHINEPAEAVTHMNEEFGKRYGRESRPHFYAGSLRDAVEVALHCTASERRLLAVYVHHDKSIAANIFCSQVLCSETIVNYLSANFLTWGWDITLPINKTRFITMFEQVVGRDATDFLRYLKTDELPVLVVLAKLKGSFEVLSTMRASSTTEEMMSSLLLAEDRFQQARTQDVVEEQERKDREQMKALQDAAYEASLAVDREKQNQKEEEERIERNKQDTLKLEQETMEAIKQSVANSIPEEPAVDSTETMARLRFRCADGKMLTRRFLGGTELRTLFNYLVTEGYRIEEFKLLTTFPRRDLTLEDETRTLKDLKLCPQETLILEAK